MHPRRLAQLSKTQNIERLLKLILVQGETIQNQILRLKERENQIEELEREQHETRVNVLGEFNISRPILMLKMNTITLDATDENS